LLSVSRRIVTDARRVVEETKSRRRSDLKQLREKLQVVATRVEQVIKQAKTRIFEGNTKLPERS
jgi:hypothetical protein